MYNVRGHPWTSIVSMKDLVSKSYVCIIYTCICTRVSVQVGLFMSRKRDRSFVKKIYESTQSNVPGDYISFNAGITLQFFSQFSCL